MKILVATQGPGGLDDVVSAVFGRAPSFTIVEVEGKQIKNVETLTNPAANAFGGAGIQAAQLAVEKGVNVVITGNMGPNASMVLQQSGIQIVTDFVGMKVKDAIDAFLQKGFSSSQQLSTTQPMPVPTVPYQVGEKSKLDLEFEKRMLELQKQMIEEQIKYIEKKIKELEGKKNENRYTSRE
ncbi:MAG: hypothetical protein J7K98_01535 [Candidatus Aenigmarchaeota archaeon]|nr:hypothetical protein [Candidatus Aenigmarchaeota archaeon]